MNKFRITIGSLPDRENLVADIFYNNTQVAEISQETEKLIIEIYSYQNKDWQFDLEEFQKVVEESKQKLIAIG